MKYERKYYVAYGAIWTTPGGPDDGGICILKADRDDDRTMPTERDANVKRACDALNAVPNMLQSLEIAEGFISGFEDDDAQENIPWMLATIRNAITEGKLI